MSFRPVEHHGQMTTLLTRRHEERKHEAVMLAALPAPSVTFSEVEAHPASASPPGSTPRERVISEVRLETPRHAPGAPRNNGQAMLTSRVTRILTSQKDTGTGIGRDRSSVAGVNFLNG